ncbi:MAG: N-formylglutamate amidohydrolase [Alphaproteobacteria bacterium]|nr:N-formylglutamate amidohydrolase [Alphaproteobacteria bacterium]
MDRSDPITGSEVKHFSGQQGRADSSADAPYTILTPKQRTSPLIFNSPHSGTAYPDDLIASTRLDRISLRRSEDSFVDMLFDDAPRYGAPLLKALFPRAYLDVNREAFELDPVMFEDALPEHANTRSLRVAAGFGTIARVVAEGMAIYREKLSFSEAERRISALYHPYHSALSDLLSSSIRLFGCAVLIDCHSMPSLGAPQIAADRRSADIILGDRYGTSCAPLISQTIENVLREQGYQVVRNSPYAGGYITDCYGRPGQGQHAVQIEINRALYMDENLVAPSEGFPGVKDHMSALIAALSQRLTPELLLAATV